MEDTPSASCIRYRTEIAYDYCKSPDSALAAALTPAGPLILAGYCGKPPAASWLDDTMTLLPAAFITLTSTRRSVWT
jgi:hypothetical protein